ncbi:hypothetical protein QWZ13_11415 [Reinekea marina]|uniref:hypothetical protein n=1 Tax=Reinekea marina TaxID=1310421 RepID=UPI0025B464F8|nr:hypothetical protein [Reinekea marina]MDN3649523.1 hypothetical protein [Reinekea marina]
MLNSVWSMPRIHKCFNRVRLLKTTNLVIIACKLQLMVEKYVKSRLCFSWSRFSTDWYAG